MTAIPEDVKIAAQQVKAAVNDCPHDEMQEAIVSRAIMAERRRCALIARRWQESSFKDEKFAANSIADKIMAGAA